MRFALCQIINEDVVIFYDIEGNLKSVCINDAQRRGPCPEFDQNTGCCRRRGAADETDSGGGDEAVKARQSNNSDNERLCLFWAN